MAPKEITSLTDLLDCLAEAGGAPGEEDESDASNPHLPDRIPVPTPVPDLHPAPSSTASPQSRGWESSTSGSAGDSDGSDDNAQPGDDDPVSLGDMLDAIGRRSFGPLLLLPGVIVVAPIVGDIPTVPTLMALVILLVAVQLLMRRREFWLPRWLTRRSVKRKRMRKAVRGLRKPAGWVDRIVRRRLTAFTGDTGSMVIAATCVAIAVAIPPMELIPFTATAAGTAVAGFGMALIAEDGLVALLSFAFTVGSFWWAISALL